MGGVCPEAVKDKEAVFESRSEGAVKGGPGAEHSRQRTDPGQRLWSGTKLSSSEGKEGLSWGSGG